LIASIAYWLEIEREVILPCINNELKISVTETAMSQLKWVQGSKGRRTLAA
jgi:hypothetical protein